MAYATYNERKAAQAAAYLLFLAGGRLPLIKLLKLMYLAERASLREFGELITGDHLVSMDHGPVLSRTYSRMNGTSRGAENGWDKWVSDRADHYLELRDRTMVRSSADLKALSRSDLQMLNEVYTEFGHVDRWDLVEYTHTLPEWKDPRGSSYPIDFELLLESLGYSKESSRLLRERMDDTVRLVN